jgi:hypothetical protein
MDRMDRIDEGDRLVWAHRVEQVLVSVDEGLLPGVVETARHGFRLAIEKAQAVQQGDQPRAAVARPKGPLQKGPDPSDAVRTMGVDPLAQRFFLFAAEAAAASFVAEALQRRHAAALVGPMPIANRVVVRQQSRRDPLAAPALVEKDDSVRPAGHAMLRESVPCKAGQGPPVVS